MEFWWLEAFSLGLLLVLECDLYTGEYGGSLFLHVLEKANADNLNSSSCTHHSKQRHQFEWESRTFHCLLFGLHVLQLFQQTSFLFAWQCNVRSGARSVKKNVRVVSMLAHLNSAVFPEKESKEMLLLAWCHFPTGRQTSASSSDEWLSALDSQSLPASLHHASDHDGPSYVAFPSHDSFFAEAERKRYFVGNCYWSTLPLIFVSQFCSCSNHATLLSAEDLVVNSRAWIQAGSKAFETLEACAGVGLALKFWQEVVAHPYFRGLCQGSTCRTWSSVRCRGLGGWTKPTFSKASTRNRLLMQTLLRFVWGCPV